jgi:2,4-diaminopentanoate dehydrogenase
MPPLPPWYQHEHSIWLAWKLRENGWRMLIEGDTPLDVSITFPVPQERHAAFTPGVTAHRPVNAIPYVCAASQGIRSTLELPQIIPVFCR